MTEAPPAVRPGSRTSAFAWAAGAVALALALYRPWQPRPFAVLDFSEFLPLLLGHSGFGSRLAALVRYYAIEHGRANLTSYVALAAKWSFLGPEPVRWQWARILEMLAVTGAMFAVARRFGASTFGAAAGAALFVVSRTAEDAWLRQTMGEPLGLLCILGAALVADRDGRRADRWRAPAAAALVVAAILAKEMLVGAVPLVIVAAVARGADGRLSRPDTGPRARRFAAWIGAATALALGIVVWAAHRAGSVGFGTSYGASSISAGRFVALWQTIIAPEAGLPGLGLWLRPANLAFLALAGLGAAEAWRAAADRGHLTAVAILGLGLPAIGAALYVPWPYFNFFYGLPFLAGPALLLATGVTALQRTPLPRLAAALGLGVLVTGAGVTSGQLAAAGMARQVVDHDVAAALSAVPGDSIIVFEPYLPQQAWQGTGPTLVRYALALGLADRLPPAIDLPCGKAAAALESGRGRHTFITYTDRCGAFRDAAIRLRAGYRYLDWTGLRSDTLEADIIGPAPAGPPR
jgi:hypothetical protein